MLLTMTNPYFYKQALFKKKYMNLVFCLVMKIIRHTLLNKFNKLMVYFVIYGLKMLRIFIQSQYCFNLKIMRINKLKKGLQYGLWKYSTLPSQGHLTSHVHVI